MSGYFSPSFVINVEPSPDLLIDSAENKRALLNSKKIKIFFCNGAMTREVLCRHEKVLTGNNQT